MKKMQIFTFEFPEQPDININIENDFNGFIVEYEERKRAIERKFLQQLENLQNAKI